MVALETGFHWMMRGEPEVGSGWLSRARRLLEGQGPSVAQGFLLWMDSQGRFGAGDVEGALAGAVELQRMGADLAAPMLGCFGLALEGVIAIRRVSPRAAGSCWTRRCCRCWRAGSARGSRATSTAR